MPDDIRERIVKLEARQEDLEKRHEEGLSRISEEIKSLSAKIDKLFSNMGNCKLDCKKEISEVERKLEGIKSKLMMLAAGVSIIVGIVIRLVGTGGSA